MLEIRWHGRGGQGAKTAAEFLAGAAIDAGKFIQAFPEYGPERAGAPIRSFTRISDEPIMVHCGVTRPGTVVVIDPTLATKAVLEGLPDDGVLVVNTTKSPQELKKELGITKIKVATVDATKIALDILKAPMPNTPMLGALVKVSPMVPLEKIKDKIRDKFLKKIGEEKTKANIDAIDRAYKEVRIA
ncbi:MAG: 2-oxoacid:acceptor oxidoreductase family protein [Candidatus Omnitrophota bacterium]